jgi:sugar phosphate isomerase/epimerase
MSNKPNSLSRRSFLQSSALAAAAISAGAAESIAQSARKTEALAEIRLGLASYTFRNFSRAQLIEFMKQLQLTDLNVKDAKDHLPSTSTAAEDAAFADYSAAGIKLHAAGTISLTKPDDADIHAKFEYCKRAGIGIMVAGDPTHESLPIIEKYVKQYDIRVAIHNHGPEDKLYFPSPLDVLKAIKNMDPRIGCCIDLGHTLRTGTDPIAAIHTVGARLFDLHIKDLAQADKKESQVAVGRGVMPVRGIFEALMAIKYKGFVDLEYEINADNPMPGVIESFAYMRGVLAGMGHPVKA